MGKEYYCGPWDEYRSQLKNKKSLYREGECLDAVFAHKIICNEMQENTDNNHNNQGEIHDRYFLELQQRESQYLQELGQQKNNLQNLNDNLDQNKNKIFFLEKKLEQEKKDYQEKLCYRSIIEKTIETTERCINVAKIEISKYLKEVDNLKTKTTYISRGHMGISDKKSLFKLGSSETIHKSIPENYHPSDIVIEQLTQFVKIPEDYIYEQIPEFKIYYMETQAKRLSWDQVFCSWVKKSWNFNKDKIKIEDDFTPTEETLKNCANKGISDDICMNELKSFILYWKSNNSQYTPKMWQERFFNWIQRKHENEKKYETYSRTSYPTTEELANTQLSERYQFNFDDE